MNNLSNSANMINIYELLKSNTLLTVDDFATKMNITYNDEYYDMFWEAMTTDNWIFITDLWLEWIERYIDINYINYIKNNYKHEKNYVHISNLNIAYDTYLKFTRENNDTDDFIMLKFSTFINSLEQIHKDMPDYILRYLYELETLNTYYLYYYQEFIKIQKLKK